MARIIQAGRKTEEVMKRFDEALKSTEAERAAAAAATPAAAVAAAENNKQNSEDEKQTS